MIDILLGIILLYIAISLTWALWPILKWVLGAAVIIVAIGVGGIKYQNHQEAAELTSAIAECMAGVSSDADAWWCEADMVRQTMDDEHVHPASRFGATPAD
ncbi:MAG: hypothetical protein ACR2PR_00280 [Pseudohongiellaceae bacterium]